MTPEDLQARLEQALADNAALRIEATQRCWTCSGSGTYKELTPDNQDVVDVECTPCVELLRAEHPGAALLREVLALRHVHAKAAAVFETIPMSTARTTAMGELVAAMAAADAAKEKP